MEDISVYRAIKEMRSLTNKGKTFSFSFMSFAYKSQTTHGIVSVNAAKLRKSPKNSRGTLDDIMLHYTDDNGEAKRCYQCCLMTFQGQKLKL